MHFLSFSLLILIIPSVVYGLADEKKCDKNKVDRCTLELLILSDEKFLKNPPKTIPEITKWCKKLKPLEDCIKEYANDCLDSEAKQTLSVIIYGASRASKKYCGSQKRKQSLIDIFKCASPHAKHLHTVYKNMTTDFHAIGKYKPANLRVPMACCTFYKYKDVSLREMENTCPELMDEIENFVTSYTGDVLNFSCGEYTEETDKCNSVINKVPKYKKRLEYKTFLIPMVQIFEVEDEKAQPSK